MNNAFLTLLGGSALLVYSMDALSSAIQKLAGSSFRTWVNLFASRRSSGVLLGIVLSFLMSSSGAVTVMLVGLANARLLTLEQVLSVTLGAAVGTTFIVQIIAFKVSEYGLLLVVLGLIIEWSSKNFRSKTTGRSIVFLGIMFFSMTMVMEAGRELESNEFFQYTINYFRDRPVVSMGIALVFTALIHSSTATIAFVMSLMVAQQGTVLDAIPWILGANLGTTATGYLASLRGGVLGKQAAFAHLLVKGVGVILCYPLMHYLASATTFLSDEITRQIAHSHTLFNLAIALLFFPFVGFGVRFVTYLISEEKEKGPFSFQYLDERSLQTPELALAQAQKEILRVTDLVEKMVVNCLEPFSTGNRDQIKALREKDRIVDFLNKGIKLYLTRLTPKEMTPTQIQQEFEFLSRTNDLESIGDIVDKTILGLVKKNLKKGYVFSREGWSEITVFHEKVVECLKLADAYFSSGDEAINSKLELLEEELDSLMIDLTEQHVKRLHRGIKETLDTTSVHLDLLASLKNIALHATNFRRLRSLRREE